MNRARAQIESQRLADRHAPFGNTTYLGWLWSGFQVTVALSITAWIIAFLVGSIFGILRT
ncbi:hypothetical protein ONO39_26085, partial [Salmonella enterica subsp. enterica serovar Anatum]|nr:hypothetical protein [Salmonella enterica subsp. enterica serovar Anatum]